MKKFLLCICSFFLVFLPAYSVVAASDDLDRILEFTIHTKINQDASIDFQYDILWKVLDDTSEGPLEWVEIGIPNYHCTNLTANSSTIRRVELESSSSLVRCDFDRSYHKDEIVSFSFSFHQEYMFRVEGENEESISISYMTPYFKSLKIDELNLYWDASVSDISHSKKDLVGLENGYYYYRKTNVGYSGRIELESQYEMRFFPTIDLKKASEDSSTVYEAIATIFIMLFIIGIIVAIILAISKSRKNYYRGRGFTSRYHGGVYMHHHHHCPPPHGPHEHHCGGPQGRNPERKSSGFHGGSGSSHSCACACACACAGGGRAGCSRKDFYHPTLEYKRVKEILKK